MAEITRNAGGEHTTDAERLARIRESIALELGHGEQNRDLYSAQLKERIAKYECEYGMPSKRMLMELQSGQLEETRDIARWAWTWQTLNRLHKATHTGGTR